MMASAVSMWYISIPLHETCRPFFRYPLTIESQNANHYTSRRPTPTPRSSRIDSQPITPRLAHYCLAFDCSSLLFLRRSARCPARFCISYHFGAFCKYSCASDLQRHKNIILRRSRTHSNSFCTAISPNSAFSLANRTMSALRGHFRRFVALTRVLMFARANP